MIPAARISAAIEILADLDEKKRPATDSVKDWGLTHRFAGSKDRAAISSLVFDALRCKASSGFLMADDAPRGIVLGMLKQQRGMDGTAVAALFTGAGHAPAILNESEAARLPMQRWKVRQTILRATIPTGSPPRWRGCFPAVPSPRGGPCPAVPRWICASTR